MLTGGFRTTSVMKDAVASNQLDIVGIARPFAVYPTIGNDICNESKINFNTEIRKTGIKGIDGAMNIIWYEAQIKLLGKGKAPKPDLNPWWVFLKYSWLILEQKITKPKK